MTNPLEDLRDAVGHARHVRLNPDAQFITTLKHADDLLQLIDNLKLALHAHHMGRRCICADFDFASPCKCWMTLNTGPNGECEKCGGIKQSETKT